MNLFVQSIVICALIVNISATALIIYKFFKMEGVIQTLARDFDVEMSCWQDSFGEYEDKIENIAYETTKSLIKLNEIVEKLDKDYDESIESFSNPTQLPENINPIKKNNWDGMKAVFSRPARVVPDERN